MRSSAVHCHVDVPLLVHEVAVGHSAPLETDLDQGLGVCDRPILRSVPRTLKADLFLTNQAFISFLGARHGRVEVRPAHVEDSNPQSLACL